MGGARVLRRGRGVAGVLALLLLLVGLAVGAEGQEGVLEAPRFEPGERWVYTVTGRLDELLGLGGSEGSLEVEGEATLTPVQADEENWTLRWEVDLVIEGNSTLPLNGNTTRLDILGTLHLERTERYRDAIAFPVGATSRTDLDVTVEQSGVSIGYFARLTTVVNVTDAADLPVYPLGPLFREVAFRARVQTNVTVGVGESEFPLEESTVDVESAFRLTVALNQRVAVPAGEFETAQVRTRPLRGATLGPLQQFLPQSTEAVDVALESGAPVRILLLDDGQEAVNASLRTHVPAGLPLWQQPVFLLALPVLLAVPVVILIYLARRERTRGL